MGAFILFFFRRAGWYIATLWIVYTVSFFLMRAVPGGPFDAERNLPPEVRANVEARYNLDQPLLAQYLASLRNLTFRGDFGPSLKIGDFTVNEIIGQGFPVSASLGIFAMVFAISLGTTAGVISAIRRESIFDFSFMVAATVGIAVPNLYWPVWQSWCLFFSSTCYQPPDGVQYRRSSCPPFVLARRTPGTSRG